MCKIEDRLSEGRDKSNAGRRRKVDDICTFIAMLHGAGA